MAITGRGFVSHTTRVRNPSYKAQVGGPVTLLAVTSAGTSTASCQTPCYSIAFPSTSVLDNFNRADSSSLGSSWSRPLFSASGVSLRITSNQMTANNDGADGYWSRDVWPANQEAYVTLGTISATVGFQIHVRATTPGSSATLNSYYLDYDADQGAGNAYLGLWKRTPSSTLLTEYQVAVDLQVGDKIGIRAIGNYVEAWTKKGAGAWTRVLLARDTSVTSSGYIGFYNAWAFDTYDDWGGGTYNPLALASVTSSGTGSVSGNNLKIRLPNVSSAGTGTASQAGLKIRMPSRTSAGTATASQAGVRIKLPNRTSAGATTAATATAPKIQLPSRTSAGTGTANATALKILVILPARTSAGVGTASQSGLRIALPTRTSAGVGSVSQGGLKIRLPARTSAGVATINQNGLKERFGVATTAGSSTATQSGLKIRLPSRTVAGSGSATQTGFRAGLPVRTTAGTSTASATALKIRLPNRTSAGVGSASLPLTVRLPPVVSAGGTGAPANIQLARDHGTNGSASASTTLTIPTTAAVAAGDYLVITGTSSSGTATVQTIAVTSGTDPGNLSWTVYDQVGNATGAFIAFTRCPTGVNNAVTFTVTWSGVAFGTRRLGLTEWSGLASSSVEDTHQGAVSSSTGDPTVNITTANANDLVIAGISMQVATTLTPNGTFIEIHDDSGGSRTHGTIYQIESSTGTWAPGADAASNNHWAISALALKAAGTGSGVVATALKIALPARTGAGSSTASATSLSLSGGPTGLPSVSTAGTSTANVTALKIRLPGRTTAGIGVLTQSGLKIRLPSRSTAGTSSVSQAGLRDRIGQVTSAGTSTATAQAFRIRLPSRTTAGVGTTSTTGIRERLPSRTSAGTSTASATAFKIKLPNRTSAGVGATSSTNLAGAVSNLQTVTSAGSSSASQGGLRIRLPSRSVSGTGAASAPLGVRLPVVVSAGSVIQTVIFADFETSNDSFVFSTSGGVTGSVTAPSALYANTRSNSSRLVGTGAASAGLASARRTISGLLPFARYRITAKVLVESCDTTTWTSANGVLVHGGTGASQTSVNASAINRTTLGTWQTTTATFVTSSNPNALGPYFEWVRFNTGGSGSNSFAAHGDTVSLDLVDAVKPFNIRLPNLTSGGTSTASATALKIKLGARTTAGTGTASQTGLRIRLPVRSSVGQGTATAANFTIGANFPARTSAGTSTATAQKFNIRLPSRTTAGTSTATTTGALRDKLPAMASSGTSTCTQAGLRVKLPSRSVAGTSSTLGRLTPRLPGRISAGQSTATATSLRIGLVVLVSDGFGMAIAQPFQIRLPSAFSNGTSQTFAGSFLYIPPPPKVVEAGSTSQGVITMTGHSEILNVSTTSTTAVTASSSSPVTTGGDLTRIVNIGS